MANKLAKQIFDDLTDQEAVLIIYAVRMALVEPAIHTALDDEEIETLSALVNNAVQLDGFTDERWTVNTEFLKKHYGEYWKNQKDD